MSRFKAIGSVAAAAAVIIGLYFLAPYLAAPFLSPPQTAAPPGPPTVTVAKPVVRQIVEDDEFVGRFEAVDEVTIRSRVGGYLDAVHFQDGTLVKKGDLLFTIDRRPFTAALTQARAQLDVGHDARRLHRSPVPPRRKAHRHRSGFGLRPRRAPAGISGGSGPGRRRQGGGDAGRTRSRIHRDQGAARRADRPPARLGRQSRPGRPDGADDDRLARSDQLLFRRRRARVPGLCARCPRSARPACRKAPAASK